MSEEAADSTDSAGSAGNSSCDHDWTVVNRDENRLIYKCPKCGALRRE
jgi:hypothetical protein